MAMTTGRSDSQVYSDINMTPLIDVMLVLLIIFIITIPSPTHSVTIDNPVAALPELAQPRVIDVAIDFDGAVSWNGHSVDRDILQTYIRFEAAASPQPEIHLSVDRFAKYEVVAQTLADLQRQGLGKIGFVNNDNL
jgi:biopolymer transport protein ExbD